MQFLLDNYIYILIIVIFLLFSLIGYIIDTYKNQKDENYEKSYEKNQIKVDEIKDTNYESTEKKVNEEIEEQITDKGDDLLNNYDNIK